MKKQSNVFTRFLLALAALAVVTGAISPALAQTNLIQDGGFEGMVGAAPEVIHLTLGPGTPSSDLPYWTTSQPGTEGALAWGAAFTSNGGNFPAAKEGSHYLNLTSATGSTGTASVSQSFTVTGGAQYSVSYYGAARDSSNKVRATMTFDTAGGGVYDSAELTVYPGDPLSDPWTHQSFTFTAPVGATLANLEFHAATPKYWGDGVFLDDVLVTATSGNSSEYTAWAHTHAGDQSPSEDYNNDGVSNGVAFFMGKDGLATNPGVENGKVTWPHVGVVTSYKVQVSTDLGIWTDADPGDVDEVSSPGFVIYTFPKGIGIPEKKFCRLQVTP